MEADPARGRWRIAALSGSILVLELAFIRQVPAEVRGISYFTNLLLVASFFGLGIGCILQDGRRLDVFLPVGLLLMAGFLFYGRGLVIHEEASAVHYWLQDPDPDALARSIPLYPAVLAAFLIAAMPFVALGQMLAVTMNRLPRLEAYSWDILGSLAGTILFSVSSFLEVPPWVWPPAIGVLWAACFAPSARGKVLAAAAGLPFLLFSQTPLHGHWSPYYFVQYGRDASGLMVFVNSVFHQLAIDFESKDPAIRGMQAHALKKFSLPYDLYREHHGGADPKRVLVLGAGTGNDVVIALRNRAERIVAVEIDPAILRLGRTLSPSRPYDDPRVVAVVDDARHYLRTTPERFDLVILGTLDSQTLLSGKANMRLENYVYTAESFADAREVLVDGGLLGAYYSTFGRNSPWVAGRVLATVRAAFGDSTKMAVAESTFLFNTIFLAAKGIDGFARPAKPSGGAASPMPSTDDWPFVYMERPTISPLYLKLFGTLALLIAGVFLLLRRVHPVPGLHLEFLLLGLGFTLMESAAVVRMALVFGSTWTVNAVVFASVLLTAFLANLAVLKGRAPSLRVAGTCLVGAILLAWLFPLPVLFHVPPLAKLAACGVLVGLPVLCAGVCFSRLFAEQATTGYALGVNLVGAMAGGLVEYLSMLLGMRAIWLVALGVYLLAFLVARRRRGAVRAT